MFHSCSSLKSIAIPENVSVINDYSFYGCSSLEEIILPEELVAIGNYAFYYCTSIKSLNIPASVTTILTGIVAGCDSLTTLTVDEKNKTFDSREGCNAIIITKTNCLYTGIGTTVIPDSVTSIERYAFNHCKSLTQLKLPASVTALGDRFVYECPNLDTIIIDEANPAYTSADSNVIIEKSTNTLILGSNNAVIPDGVVKINSNAFVGFNKLEALHIPASVTSISFSSWGGSFGNNSSLKSITVDENNTVFDSRGNCNAIIYTANNSLQLGCNTTTIPDGVQSIASAAFSDCTGLEKIEIPESVTSIGTNAFYNCTALESIVIPESVTSIGMYAFDSCEKLSSVKLSSNIESIPYGAFKNCTSLTEIVIPDSVNSIIEYAFCGCSSLETITLPASLTGIGYGAFYGCEALKTVYYKGTDENKAAITTAEENECLTSAGWIHLHTKSDFMMVKKPSCSEEGCEYYFCAVCDEKVIAQQIAKLPHTPETIPGVAPTCTENGKTAGEKCSVCGEIITATTVVPATGHKWNEGEITTPATTEAEGVKTFTCTVCGTTKTESIPVTAPAYTPGDVDGKDGITVADARLALRRSIGLETYAEGTPEFLACDVNMDGQVKVEDARLILRAAIHLDDPSNWKKA